MSASIESRLQRLEQGSGGCPACPGNGARRTALVGDDGEQQPSPCPVCGRVPAVALVRHYGGVNIAQV